MTHYASIVITTRKLYISNRVIINSYSIYYFLQEKISHTFYIRKDPQTTVKL